MSERLADCGTVAHRGAHRHGPGPENSLRAIADALDQGFGRFECDLLPSRDGALIVAHGPRTGHGGGEPSELVIVDSERAELEQVRLADGSGLPSLESVLELLASHPRARAVLELKDSERGRARNLAFARAVAACVAGQGLAARVEYISFDYEMLAQLRRLDASAKCAPLAHCHTLERYLEDGMWGVDFDHRQHFLAREEIARYQDAGLVVNCWTVNERARLEQLIDWGIDLITTDEPELLAQLWAEQALTR